MIAAFAGVLDTNGRLPDRSALARAAGAGAEVAAQGPLGVAWTGGGALCDGVLCVIDGSVYNLEELADEPHEATTPAQVLARAFRRLGEGLLERLRGDFALLLWERAAGRGLVARDQLGGRAVSFHAAGSRLAFATEVVHLLPLLARRPAPDQDAVRDWLALSPGGLPDGRTFYDGVRRLEPGHYFRLQPDGFRLLSYWRPRYVRPAERPRDEVVKDLRGALARAVARRAPKGDLTGVMLSGGLDSSSVAAFARRADPAGTTLRAYSAVFPGHASVDESGLIDLLTRELALPGRRIRVREGSLLSGALEYQRAWDVPLVSPNLAFWRPLFARVRGDGLSALLDGEGGDELFWFAPYLLADRLRAGRPLAAYRLVRELSGEPPVWRWIARMLIDYGVRGALPYRLHRFERHGAPAWFSSASARSYQEQDGRWEFKRGDAPLWWGDLVRVLTGNSLAYDHLRRRAALAGLEARHPLVDLDVVELVLRTPPELAFDARFTRPLLRASVAGLLPDEVRLRRAKSWFNELIQGCLAGPDLPALQRLLGARDAELLAYARPDRLRDALLQPPPASDPVARQRWSVQVWRAATAECWLRSQADDRFGERLRATVPLPEPEHDIVPQGPLQ